MAPFISLKSISSVNQSQLVVVCSVCNSYNLGLVYSEYPGQTHMHLSHYGTVRNSYVCHVSLKCDLVWGMKETVWSLTKIPPVALVQKSFYITKL